MPSHPEFNAGDADVIIQSSDGIGFYLHRKYLEAHTGAFPGPGDGALHSNTQQDVTCLTEPSSVLGILFQFVYPRKHPTLEDVEFKTLAALAEAVEKYEVFSAMGICEVRLQGFIPDHPVDILAHAIKHGYPKLINETALYLSPDRIPSYQIVKKLPFNAIVPWLRYYEAWKKLLGETAPLIEKQYRDFCSEFDLKICWSCSNRSSLIPDLIAEKVRNPKLPDIIDHIFKLNSCSPCLAQRNLRLMIGMLAATGQLALPLFTDFLSGNVEED